MSLFSFDAGYYQSTYDDMSSLSADDAHSHFLGRGLMEGRVGSAGGVREHFTRQIPRDLPVLEIGPFAGPVLAGSHVRYADVMPTAGLRERAIALGIDPTGCPEIHYVLSDFDLGRIPDRFAAVFSSHCIEHQPDLVRHLQAVQALLHNGGKYFIIAPDKRYCFDHFIPESSIADVMTAYMRGNKVHDVGSIIEHWALTTHNDNERHWQGDHGRPRIDTSVEPMERAVQAYRADPAAYIDVHAWQFTPASFAEICRLLNTLGLTTLKPVELHNTAWGRNEFCAVLQNESTGPG